LVVNDLEDLFTGVEGAQHLLTDGALGDALNEVVGDGVVDVGIEQRFAHFLHGLTDVGFRDASAAAQLLERFAEIALNTFKHSLTPPLSGAEKGAAGPPSEGAPRNRVNHSL